MPSAPAPGGHEGLTPPSKLSGELDREIKEGSFAGPLLGVLSSTGVSSVSGLGLTEEKKKTISFSSEGGTKMSCAEIHSNTSKLDVKELE